MHQLFLLLTPMGRNRACKHATYQSPIRLIMLIFKLPVWTFKKSSAEFYPVFIGFYSPWLVFILLGPDFISFFIDLCKVMKSNRYCLDLYKLTVFSLPQVSPGICSHQKTIKNYTLWVQRGNRNYRELQQILWYW